MKLEEPSRKRTQIRQRLRSSNRAQQAPKILRLNGTKRGWRVFSERFLTNPTKDLEPKGTNHLKKINTLAIMGNK